MKKNILIILLILFCFCPSVFLQNQNIEGFESIIEIKKKCLNSFYSSYSTLGEFSPFPKLAHFEYDRSKNEFEVMGVVIFGLNPIENIDIYICKKNKHFGRNTELWDSRFKIVKHVGKNNIPFYSLGDEHMYYDFAYSKKNITETIKEIEKLEKSKIVWQDDTTGVFSIRFKSDEYPIFWSPALKKGTLLFIQ